MLWRRSLVSILYLSQKRVEQSAEYSIMNSNIFCCNCDDGCLGGSNSCPSVCGNSYSSSNNKLQHELKSLFNINDNEKKTCGFVMPVLVVTDYGCLSLTNHRKKLEDADEDSDGNLSYFEWVAYTAGDRLVNLTEAKERWSLFDQGNKGYLMKDEAYNRQA